ncbi:RecB-like helicase [Helicobacter sp. L8]|uniref:RecB-like helicase n=1 Tax=Helicobacter sp. L8 TaxID=2316078 RepID=UPI000EB591E7|nr:RecB-like helicase [Helicobacter sp. L8]
MLTSESPWLALRASAGSGKTFALVLRYVALLLKGARAHEILALTFTNKAALQMQERITQALEDLLVDGQSGGGNVFKNAALLDALAQQYALDRPTIAHLIPKVYAQFLQDDAQIMTIDAFLQKVLRKFSYFVGVSASFKVSHLGAEDKMLGFLNTLSTKEKSRLELLCVNLLSAGTSFNALYALDFILTLYYSGVDIDALQRDTHDLKALQEQIVQEARALQEKILLRVSTPSAKKALKCDSIQDILGCVKPITQGAHYHYFKTAKLQDLTPDFQALHALIVRYYQAQERAVFKDLHYFLNRYQTHTHSPTALDFNAIALKTHTLLTRLLDKDFFYFRLDSRISHILVDEFQDTSVLQYQILQPLIAEIRAGKGQNLAQRSVFFVGDAKQSIYGFRGSYSDLFAQVCDQFPSKPLIHNYRSDRVVLDFINEKFKAVFEGYQVQSAHAKAQEGYVKVCQVSKDDRLNTLCQEVSALLQAQVDPSEITILCFKNDDVTTIKNHLLESKDPILEGIPIISETDTRLLAQREAKILMHALKHALAPQAHKSYHRACMLKLLGMPLSASLDLPDYNTNLSAFILNFMRAFGLYSPPARHFLELSLAHHDSARFIESLEKEDLGFSHQGAQGIKVMTIHKSKGMEFGHVLVIEPFSGDKPDTSKFFTLYLEKRLKPFYRQKQREYFDPDYARALQIFKERNAKEKQNVLYVACTRAKHSLIIVQQTEGSVFKTLDLQPFTQGTIAPSPTPPSAPSLEHTPALLENQRAFGRQNDHLLQEEENPQLSSQALRFGEVLHKALELHYGYGVALGDLAPYLHHHYSFMGVDIPQVLARVQALQAKSAFQAYLQAELRAEVCFKTGQQVWRMDMLACDPPTKRLYILDYKSGETYQHKHRQQVLGYQQRAQHLYPHCQVQGVLIYALESGVQVRPISL